MKTPIVFGSMLALACTLGAQDAKVAMPDPKTPAHAALAGFVGHWQSTCKMAAMPGVPGMEEAKEWTGTEHCELVCNGLWLKSTLDSECKGESFAGLFLIGYDPLKKQYVGIWTSSQDEPSSMSAGAYDSKTRTWTFSGSSPMGEFRSVLVFSDADNSVETCYMKGADGKEIECMQLRRQRTKAAEASVRVANKAPAAAAAPSKAHAHLARGVGEWDATVTLAVPGEKPSVEPGTEQVSPVCQGRWYWSHFQGTMMGTPFEGYGLTGFEPATNQVVAYWIDSFSPFATKTVGTYDAASGTCTMAGDGIDMTGKPIKMHEVCTQKDADTREFAMTCKGADATSEMKIVYKRKR